MIPLNIADGSLICMGKGNFDWNNSAPDGAGRALSRMQAKDKLTMQEYKKKFPQMPAVKFIKLGEYITAPTRFSQNIGYRRLSDDIHKSILDFHCKINHPDSDYKKIWYWLEQSYADFIPEIININLNTFSGIITWNGCREYHNIYYDKSESLKIENSFYQKFGDWYTKNLDFENGRFFAASKC